MNHTNAPQPHEHEHAAVRIIGTPTDTTDHPALRKIARAVLSIAARQLDEQPTQESSDDGDGNV
jgi:hypothetical protein